LGFDISSIQENIGLNEQQYRLLCDTCDYVLRVPDLTIERVAIPWLHIIREHPVFLASYVDLFEPAKGRKEFVRKWWRVVLRKAGWLRQILMPFRADGRPWFGPDDLPSGIDVLFVSHLLNLSQAGQTDDFYFGGLPNEMVQRGHSTMIALINHSGQAVAHLADNWSGGSVPRVILSGSLRFLEEAALRHRLKMESLRLRKLAQKEEPGLLRRILARASEEALSGGSLTALRVASQIGALTDKLKPKAIVATHEGHAWERVAFAAARRAFPDVRCIGYQHAALFRLQHAIRRNLAREYNPDHILTAGAISKAQLESAPGLNGIPISVLGSNRTLNGIEAIRQRTSQADQAQLFNNPACLVLPEGIASECHLLFEFSLACAKLCPEIQFIWRLHPIMTYESLAAQNRKLRKLPRNIVLSQATLEEDIARCCCALYRGTTAIIQAVVAGLRPIYLQLPGEMTIDPLYELRDWRISVKTIVDFHSAIRNNQNRLLMDSESEFRFAEGYCRNFFKPLNPGALEATII
jgi:hypothetical protein